ncbi:MAG: DUF2147 domain-containing protein [Litorimonas sp.]
MTRTRLVSAALLLPALLMAPAALAHHDGEPHGSAHVHGTIHGLWLTEEGTATVRIADCGPGPMEATPCGVVETADIPDGEPTTDVNNADPALRDMPILGLTMLDGFEADGDGRWKKGRIYNPEDGKSYKSAIRLDGDDPNVLRVKGCIAFLCQTQEWSRVTD